MTCSVLILCLFFPKGGQCLITKLECEDGVSEDESKAFTSEDKAAKPSEPTQEDSAEDLVRKIYFQVARYHEKNVFITKWCFPDFTK